MINKNRKVRDVEIISIDDEAKLKNVMVMTTMSWILDVCVMLCETTSKMRLYTGEEKRRRNDSEREKRKPRNQMKKKKKRGANTGICTSSAEIKRSAEFLISKKKRKGKRKEKENKHTTCRWAENVRDRSVHWGGGYHPRK